MPEREPRRRAAAVVESGPAQLRAGSTRRPRIEDPFAGHEQPVRMAAQAPALAHEPGHPFLAEEPVVAEHGVEGGRSVAPEELPKLLGELARRPPEYEVRQTRWKLAGTAADAWLFLLVLTSLLTSEWFLRKRWGLV